MKPSKAFCKDSNFNCSTLIKLAIGFFRSSCLLSSEMLPLAHPMTALSVPKPGLQILIGCGNSRHTEGLFLQIHRSFCSCHLAYAIHEHQVTDFNASSVTDANLSAHSAFGCPKYARDTETNCR